MKSFLIVDELCFDALREKVKGFIAQKFGFDIINEVKIIIDEISDDQFFIRVKFSKCCAEYNSIGSRMVMIFKDRGQECFFGDGYYFTKNVCECIGWLNLEHDTTEVYGFRLKEHSCNKQI